MGNSVISDVQDRIRYAYNQILTDSTYNLTKLDRTRLEIARDDMVFMVYRDLPGVGAHYLMLVSDDIIGVYARAYALAERRTCQGDADRALVARILRDAEKANKA